MPKKIRFVGLDVHKHLVQACFLDADGKELAQKRFGLTRESLRAFARRDLRRSDRVALEATTNSWSVVKVLKEHVPYVVVSNPIQTKAIGSARLKSDKVDARMLAQLLRLDFLPLVWEPDELTQELRSLTSRRIALVQDRTAARNRIHSALHQSLMAFPAGSPGLFTRRGLRALRDLLDDLPPVQRLAVQSDLRLAEGFDREIARLEDELARRGSDDDRLKLLMTLPGVDLVVAQAILAALGDVERFPSASKAASYFGLTPRLRASADKTRFGKISKAGNSHARAMLVQAAWSASRSNGPLAAFYRKLTKRKSAGTAITAVARKLVTYAWHMLKNGEPYRYGSPVAVSLKLRRLRLRTGGPRRSSHPAEAAGVRRTDTETLVPSLRAVYDAEGLPPPTPFDELSEGERRMLRRKRIVRKVRALESPQRKPRPSRQGRR